MVCHSKGGPGICSSSFVNVSKIGKFMKPRITISSLCNVKSDQYLGGGIVHTERVVLRQSLNFISHLIEHEESRINNQKATSTKNETTHNQPATQATFQYSSRLLSSLSSILTMMRRDDEDLQQEELVLRPPHPLPACRQSAIISGDSDNGETDELYEFDPSNPSNADALYDSNMDEEDAAYVYRHMRSGLQETMTVLQNATGDMAVKKIAVYKPRYSDAQLQCPCCFQLVCMDCQRHERYQNQYRAMFVMGVVVDWHTKLVYDESQQALLAMPLSPESESPLDEKTKHVEGEYFRVLCGNCRTQVAALDMKEEVYHFHGCLESSS